VAALLEMLEQHPRHHPAEVASPEITVRTHPALSAWCIRE
jgi:hypothetical protein